MNNLRHAGRLTGAVEEERGDVLSQVLEGRHLNRLAYGFDPAPSHTATGGRRSGL